MTRTYFSTSVMANRKEPLNSLDDYPTPPWATRALFYMMDLIGIPIKGKIWEPASGRGYMAKVFREFELVTDVFESDVYDYGRDDLEIIDFVNFDFKVDKVDWIITNPPFKLGMEFTLRSLEMAEDGVAIFSRLQWLETKKRYEVLFSRYPPTFIFPFVERVNLHKREINQKTNSATAYAWYVWLLNNKLPRKFPLASSNLIWIPPVRAILEKEDDYT